MPNATDGIDVELATFGGIFTDMDPACLPDGASPDSQDVCFLPGDAFTRPAFKRLYIAGAFQADVVWNSNFTLNSGLKLNIYLLADGSLWKEDAVNAPGAFVQFGTVPAGSLCKAAVAFGRMYFTFSDGVHGADHAWQYDGANFDRVSQDGPAAALTLATPQNPAPVALSTLRRANGITTANTTGPITLAAGNQVQIAGVQESPIGGDVTSLVVKNNICTATTSQPHGVYAGNTVRLGTISNATVGNIASMSRAGDVVTVVMTVAHGLGIGSYVQILGSNDTTFNASVSVESVPSPTTFTFTQSDNDAVATAPFGTVANVWPLAASAASNSNANLFEVATVPTPTTFTFPLPYPDSTWNGITATLSALWDGTFYVQSILTPGPSGTCTQFTYVDDAPDASFDETTALAPQVSTVGQVTVQYWGDSSHSSNVGSYYWRNAADVAAAGCPIRSSVAPSGTNSAGNSLLFDTAAGIGDGTPMEWTLFGPGGTLAGTIPLFQPGSYANFNFALTGMLYIPAAGTYNFTGTFKDDILFGIQGATLVPGAAGTLSNHGQTMTALNGYPLLPRVAETSGEGGYTGSINVNVSFPAAGYYAFEVDYDYWYHSGRTLQIQCNGQNIVPAVSASGATAQLWGQVAPGKHRAVCLFQTRNAFITAPGPYVEVSCPGGGQIQVSNVPIGPPNVIARIIAFTGANGSEYRYLGVAPMVGSQIVGTSTVIPDNVSTSAVFDFGDTSLLSGTAIDIEGNNTFAQVTLGPVCGVEYYADRMGYYGEDNRVLNLLNMGFEGGFLSGSTQPLAWTITGTVALANASNGGQSLNMTAGSSISQSAFQTSIGAAILDPVQTYSFKAKVLSAGNPSPVGITATLSSVSGGGVIATATLPSCTVPAGQWQYLSAPFVGTLPKVIPADMLLTISAAGVAGDTVGVDEMAMIFAQSPYNENTFRVSYVINPESFDGETGVMGPSQDTSKIQSTFIVRSTLYINTRDRLHMVKDLEGTEPGGWNVDEVENECGAVSLYGLIIGRNPGAKGNNWGAWVSDGGVNICGGGVVNKISLDIQQIWDTANPNALTAMNGVNDPISRRMYFFIPTGTNMVPSQTLVLDYRRMDTAEDIADRAPIRTTLSGNIIAPDLCRKWTKWTGPGLTAGYVFKGSTLTLAFSGAGKKQVYYLDPNLYTDDDYGQIPAYHITSPFASDESEQGMQLGHHRHLFAFLTGLASGIGNLTMTPMTDNLANVWPELMPFELDNPSMGDFETGMQVAGTKMFLKIEATPIAPPDDPLFDPPNPKYTNGTDTFFDISRLCATIRAHPMSPVKGRM